MPESLMVGAGGWVKFWSDALPADVYVRYHQNDGAGRLVAVDLYVAAHTPDASVLNSDLLRRIPFGRIDQLVQLPEQSEPLRSEIKSRGPRLYEEVVAHFPGRKTKRAVQKASAGHTLERLKVPSGRPFGDDFYRAVADQYRTALRFSSAPANVIAERNRVEVSQVHRWIKVARQKGFLAKGQQGKAG